MRQPKLKLLLILSLISVSVLQAQQPLDRTKIPPPTKTPELRVPAWTKTMLPNGAALIISEQHNLPLVSLSITFIGGADQFEGAHRGLAALTGSMLSEGTTTKSGDQLSDALQLLGTNVTVAIGGEQG